MEKYVVTFQIVVDAEVTDDIREIAIREAYDHLDRDDIVSVDPWPKPESSAYIIYGNENGTDAYLLKHTQDPLTRAWELIEENSDMPEFIAAFYAEIANNKFETLYALNIHNDDDED